MKVNNLFIKQLFGNLVFFLILFIFPIRVLAETNYGEGTYTGGDYNVGGSTTQAEATNSPVFNTTSPGCTNTVTSGTPDLFEIRTNKDTMVLYFSPPQGEYSSFYIAFSRDPNKWEYGTEYNQGYYPGVLKYTIHLLNSNTAYYVKMRSGNGCATGNWSDVMTAKTTTGKEKVFYKYTKIKTAVSNIKSTISKLIPIKDETKTVIEPTLIPTAVEQKQETKTVSTKTTTEKKKFCFLWWCF